MADPPRDPRIPDLVSLVEAADIIGITRQGAWRMVQRGKLRGAHVGGAWVFRRVVAQRIREQRDQEREGE